MAQSQPFLGRLEPFYGWYKRVVRHFKRHRKYGEETEFR